jgi:hypothetical protein
MQSVNVVTNDITVDDHFVPQTAKCIALKQNRNNQTSVRGTNQLSFNEGNILYN